MDVISKSMIIHIYVMAEAESAEKHIRQIREDLPDLVHTNIMDADHTAQFFPVYYHVTSFQLGWYTNHIIMIGPEHKTGRPVTKDYFEQQFSKIRYFIRNQNYKNPVAIHVYADTFPLQEEEIRECVDHVLKDEKYMKAEIIS